jgi:hypothetical protein
LQFQEIENIFDSGYLQQSQKLIQTLIMDKTQTQILIKGANILSNYLKPLGFNISLIEKGAGSGGPFAHGKFTCGDRELDFHFQHSLGLVSYKIDNLVLGHEAYIKLLGFYGKNKYPNFSKNYEKAFYALRYDLQNFLNDFTENNAEIVRQKKIYIIEEIEKEKTLINNSNKKIYSGDKKIIEQARFEFKCRNYLIVNDLRKKIQHPELMTAVEKKLFDTNFNKLNKNHK